MIRCLKFCGPSGFGYVVFVPEQIAELAILHRMINPDYFGDGSTALLWIPGLGHWFAERLRPSLESC